MILIILCIIFSKVLGDYCTFSIGNLNFDISALKDTIRVSLADCAGSPEKYHDLVLNLCNSFPKSETECVVTEGWTQPYTNAYDYYINGHFCWWSGAYAQSDVRYGDYLNSTKTYDITYVGRLQHGERPWIRTVIARMTCDPNFEEAKCLNIDVDTVSKTTTYMVGIHSSHACPL